MKHNYLKTMAAMLLTASAVMPFSANGQIRYVDLGLPSGTLWANMNVGANTESESGVHLQWGDTVSAKTDYSWTTYKWCDGTKAHMTKYCTDSAYGTLDNKTVLDRVDDAGALAVNVSSPTVAQFNELLDKKLCKWTLDTVNGKKGARVTGPNGNSIFLPAYGFKTGTRTSSDNVSGCFWTNALREKPGSQNYNAYVTASRVPASVSTPATITAQDSYHAIMATASVR